MYSNILNLLSELVLIAVMDDLFVAKAEVENFRINVHISYSHMLSQPGWLFQSL